MVKQQWDEQMALGLPKIDEQHKALIVMLNDVHSRVGHGIGEGSIEETLQGLQDYVAIHFGYEEEMMQDAEFEGLEMHGALHREFEQKLDGFSETVAKGKTSIDFEVIEFLTSWILDHIQTADAKYAASLIKAQSVSAKT